MDGFDLESYVGRSKALRTDDLDWDRVGRDPLPPDAVRTLRYMQDIEGHTIAYLRALLSTRAIDDPEVATFLACWLYEETFHSRALARFLRAAGHDPAPSQRSPARVLDRVESAVTSILSRAWPEFVAVHMVWGAINELTTLTGYRRLTEVAPHPVLVELLTRIMRDESRHFQFYFQQAEQRLARPRTARVARFVVDHFWAPVGSGVRPTDDIRFLAEYLFSGPDGLAAARKIDSTIRRLPGFSDARPIEGWIDREVGPELYSGARVACGRAWIRRTPIRYWYWIARFSCSSAGPS